ncbi:Curli production assembly/transport component CsgG [gamma proteobacterium HdN1]|nr:Curli production assembly/transport component CsgG [gamma proteobacterium HdN1]
MPLYTTLFRSGTSLAVALAIAGCATVTKPTVNTMPVTQPQVSPTLQQADFKGLKRKVAIARFSNETTAGASFLLDGKGDRVGKQASDILAARLAETGKFILLERADLDKIKDEAAIANLKQSQVGADYLIIGSVSEYGREAVSETGVFSRNKKQQARARVNVRLVEVSTGQIIYSEEGSGEALSEANTVFGVGERAGYDTSLDDKALSAAISKLVSNVVENLMDKPWQAYLVGEQGGLYIMTGGKAQGVKVGDQFAAMQRGKVMRNPQTGLNLELPGTKIGTLKVVSQAGQGDNEISLCQLTSGSLRGQALDKIIIQENH